MHKTVIVLAALPERAHGDATAGLAAISSADTRAAAVDATAVFAEAFSSDPKATTKVSDDLDHLLAFYDFPVEHC